MGTATGICRSSVCSLLKSRIEFNKKDRKEACLCMRIELQSVCVLYVCIYMYENRNI